MVGVSPAAPAGRTAKTVTAVGNAQVDTAQSKFGGASALFDGSGDSLEILTTGLTTTGDYTVECFFRVTSFVTNAHLFNLNAGASDLPGRTVVYFADTSGTMFVDTYSTGTPDYNSFGSPLLTGLSTGQFYHFAMCRSGSTTRFYLDGVLKQTGTSNVDIPNTGMTVGLSNFNGHVDELRFSHTARYTGGSLTVPTAAFVNDADTVLLVHCNGTDGSTTFTDDVGSRRQLGISAIADAKISTAQSQFGGASALFDGTGDYLEIKNFPTIGTGSYTFEGWVRSIGSPGNNGMFHLAATTLPSTSANSIAVGLTNGGGSSAAWTLYYGSSTGAGSSALINQNQWYHVAVVRNGGGSNNVKLYIDGTSVLTVTDTTNITYTNLAIGAYYANGYNLNGYIDEFRISSTARYTANFTAPSAAFTNDADTLFLMHANGTNASTVFTDDNA
jgi:hypothetical protein